MVIDTNVADAGVSAKSVVFGDFSAYYIRGVREVRFERSDDYAFNGAPSKTLASLTGQKSPPSITRPPC